MRLHSQYEVLEKIGEGGFGVVYKAIDTHLDEVVAVKELRLDDPSALREEAKILSKLRHDNVVGFRHFFPEGERWYMVMDYVDRGSLRNWIHKGILYEGGHQQALRRILSIAIHFAEGLAYAHANRVIHQDVKPGNVLIASPQIAKVSDFGIARARPVASAGDASLSLSGSGVFTIPYCSPEQPKGQRLTTKTDIWSWGLSILEMFTGGIAWHRGDKAPEVLQDYLRVGSQNNAIPPIPVDLVALLNRCFRVAPEERPSIAELVAPLNSIDTRNLHLPAISRISIAQSAAEKEAVLHGLEHDERFVRVEDYVYIDIETNLMWGRPRLEGACTAFDTRPWSAAKEIVQSYRGRGKGDWRLPTPQELLALQHKPQPFPLMVMDSAMKVVLSDSCYWSAEHHFSVIPIRHEVVCVRAGERFVTFNSKPNEARFVLAVRSAT